MKNAAKWAVAVGLAGLAVWTISTGRLTNAEGKFLGLLAEGSGLGLDDFAKGGVILGVASLGGLLVHKIGGPAPVVKA